jgi:adenine deaminase
VIIKKAYSNNETLQKVKSYYRIYVREGQTEVQVQDWTQINRTSNEFYFIFDTRDKIPNEYFVDIKVLTSGEIDTYKRTLKFQIVNKK